MKVLYAPTESFIKGQRTVLTAAVSAGSGVSIPVDNSSGFVVNGYVVVGQEGSDTAELVQVTSIPDATHLVATLALNHVLNEQVTAYAYNKRKFYGATVSGGSYTELTTYGSPVAIGVDDPQGTSLEYNGGEGYIYFKATYFNSQSDTETDIADATETLANESLRYTSIYAIRRQAGLIDNSFIDDGQIETYRKRAENEINSFIYQRYVLPLTNSTTLATEVPFIIENVCMLLAAGYADFREYGKEGEGIKWLGEARGVLKAIQLGKQRLIGTDNEELVLKTLTHGVQGWPDKVDNHSGRGPERKFGMNQNF